MRDPEADGPCYHTDHGKEAFLDHRGPVRPHASQRAVLFPGHARRAEVPTRTLKQAVKRNAARFPEDFMFQLSRDEFANLKSQIVTSSWCGLRRAAPYAFTEQGVAMLSSVLHSERSRPT
jgi:hypothetical protein